MIARTLRSTRTYSIAPDRPVRLRFAPSPTGYLHLGGLRTALLNHLLARKLKGKWILRIEDTDRNRLVEGAQEGLMSTLRWIGLDYDEGPDRPGNYGPYVQSQRRTFYKKYLNRLLDTGKAYHCFCTPERLSRMRDRLQKAGSMATYDRKCTHLSREEVRSRIAGGETHVVRLKSPDVPLVHHDMVFGDIHFTNNMHDDAIMIKTDGMPTYHFANVVDDHEMQISHVLRGEEWLTSTPKHLNLYHSLGLRPPVFAHIPLLVNPDGSKLSKRSGDVRVEDFMRNGFEPEALLNHVGIVGLSRRPGSPGRAIDRDHDSCEVLDLNGLIETFAVEGLTKHRPVLNLGKLTFLNRHHLLRKITPLSNGEEAPIVSKAQSIVQAAFGVNRWTKDSVCIRKALYALKERIHVLPDLANLASYYFLEPDYASTEAKSLEAAIDRATYHDALVQSLHTLKELPDEAFSFGSDSLSAAIDAISERNSHLKGKALMAPLRHALTGSKVGSGMKETIAALGRARVLDRLQRALHRIEQQVQCAST